MGAPISIIIPTLNAEAGLPTTLQSLFPGLAAGLIHEVLLADGGSTDATHDIAEDAGATVLSGATGRGAQLRQGADAARGNWLLFLHADSCLSEDWVSAVADHLGQADVPATFKLAFDSTGFGARVVAGGANLRTRYLSLPWGDQGLLISRVLYQRVGGFDPIPLMEDVAMARKLPRIAMLKATLTTSAGRYRDNGWFGQSAKNLLRLTRYALGAKPEDLARRYR